MKNDKYKNVISWLLIAVGFIFVLSINTSRIDAGGKFIDIERWKDITYWTQLVVNTVFLVQIYAMSLNTRKDKLLNENNDIEEEYKKLLQHKDDIINNKKKNMFEDYIALVLNLIERLEIKKYELEQLIRKINKKRSKAKYDRINAISEDIDILDKYMSALRNGQADIIDKLDLDIHSLGVKHENITYDVIFNTVDYETNKPISVGYSDTKETRRYINNSPFSAFVTMFLSILAFGNILYANDDWRSVLLIMLAVVFGALIKITLALRHAERIVKNKRRALIKTNDMIKVFDTWNESTIERLRNAVYHVDIEPVVDEPEPVAEVGHLNACMELIKKTT